MNNEKYVLLILVLMIISKYTLLHCSQSSLFYSAVSVSSAHEPALHLLQVLVRVMLEVPAEQNKEAIASCSPGGWSWSPSKHGMRN